MIRMLYGVRLVDRVSTGILQDRVGVVVKYNAKPPTVVCHVIRRDINSQIREAMGLEIAGKRKKGRPWKSWEECKKKDLE